MQLTKEQSLCEEKQKLIVSRDKGTAREHRAKNESGRYNVRHYNYEFFYRIVSSKVRTHDIQKNEFRKFKDACGSRLKYQTNLMEEKL